MLGMWVTDLRLCCLWWIALFIFRSIYPVHPLHVLGATLLHLVIVKIVMSTRQMVFQICIPSQCRYHQIMVGVGSVHLLLARHLCRCLMVCPNKWPFLSLSWMSRVFKHVTGGFTQLRPPNCCAWPLWGISDWRWSVNGALFAGSPRLQVRLVGPTQETGHVEPFVDVDFYSDYSVLRCIHALSTRDAWSAFRVPSEDGGFVILVSVDSLCLMYHLWGLQAPLLGCAVRWGEAGNPGPGSPPAASQGSILRIGTANVTRLKGREDEIKSLGPGVWALTETSSRANEIAAHRAFFKKHKLWYHPSAPCQPRTKREIACGSVTYGGVAVVSSHPTRVSREPLSKSLAATTRLLVSFIHAGQCSC